MRVGVGFGDCDYSPPVVTGLRPLAMLTPDSESVHKVVKGVWRACVSTDHGTCPVRETVGCHSEAAIRPLIPYLGKTRSGPLRLIAICGGEHEPQSGMGQI